MATLYSVGDDADESNSDAGKNAARQRIRWDQSLYTWPPEYR